jgi:toxin ParE1/3/4
LRLYVQASAWLDVSEIGLRIAEDNADAADRFFAAVENAFEFLKLHPHIGRLRSFSVAGIRSWIIPGFGNYLIFYIPTAGEVRVLAIIHGGRDLASAIKDRFG